ncbi:MAG: hypothetical protein COV45_09375 [Deltaproteobacteria bacterium CG11_big_fil_rev_8_21_14_0_20_47_16]|nr:MAG: hypothetical protein COV45_09375 [Deltaproteobacteria bacterium CG11_big_fil_rev_8_21_14_0_20_47_16]
MSVALHPFQCSTPLSPAAAPLLCESQPSAAHYQNELNQIESRRQYAVGDTQSMVALDLYEAMVHLSDPEGFMPKVTGLLNHAKSGLLQLPVGSSQQLLLQQANVAEARYYVRLASQSRDTSSAQDHVRHGIAAITPVLNAITAAETSSKVVEDSQARLWVDALMLRQSLAQLERIHDMDVHDSWMATRDTEICAARSLISELPEGDRASRMAELTQLHARTLLISHEYAEAMRLNPSLNENDDAGFLSRVQSAAMEAAAQSDRFGGWASFSASLAGCFIGTKIAATTGAAAGAGVGSIVPVAGTGAGGAAGGTVGAVGGCATGAVGGFLLLRSAAALSAPQVWDAYQTGYTAEDWQSAAFNTAALTAEGALSAWGATGVAQGGKQIARVFVEDLPIVGRALLNLPARMAALKVADLAPRIALPKLSHLIKPATETVASPWLSMSGDVSAARIAKALGYAAFYAMTGIITIPTAAQANPNASKGVSPWSDPVSEVLAPIGLVASNLVVARLLRAPHLLVQGFGLAYYGLWRWVDYRGGNEAAPFEAASKIAVGGAICTFLVKNPLSENIRLDGLGTVMGTLISTYPWMTSAIEAGNAKGEGVMLPILIGHAFVFVHKASFALDFKLIKPFFERTPFLRAFSDMARGDVITGPIFDVFRRVGFPLHRINLLGYQRFFWLSNFVCITSALEVLGQSIGASMDDKYGSIMGPWRKRTAEQMLGWSPFRTAAIMALDFDTVGARILAAVWFGIEDTILNKHHKIFSHQRRWVSDFGALLATTPSWPEWTKFFEGAMMKMTYLNGNELDVDFDDLYEDMRDAKFKLNPEQLKMITDKFRDFETITRQDQRICLFLLAAMAKVAHDQNTLLDPKLRPYYEQYLPKLKLPKPVEETPIRQIRDQINDWE